MEFDDVLVSTCYISELKSLWGCRVWNSMMHLYHLPHRLRLHWNTCLHSEHMWYFPMCSLVPVKQFYFHDSRLRRSSIDPLHVTSNSGHVRILLYGSRHFEGQVVIERKVLIVSLFANASDYSNKTCIYRYMCWYLTKSVSLVGVVTCVQAIWLVPFSQSLQYISALQRNCWRFVRVTA